MHYLARALALVAFSVVSFVATGQNVDVTDITGQPLIYMKEGEIRGCGLRMIGGNMLPLGGGETQMFDASVNINLPGFALVKIVSYNTTAGELSAGKPPRRVKVIRGWIKAPGFAATQPIGEPAAGDDGYSLLYRANLDPVIAILKAQAQGQPVNVAVRRDGEATERIYAGKIELTLAEREQLVQCMNELVAAPPR